MGEEIRLSSGQFSSHVSALKTSASSIESSINTSRSFNKTNIEPFTKDLEHLVRAVELIKRYQELLSTDIDVLEQTGEGIKEQDLNLSQLDTLGIK